MLHAPVKSRIVLYLPLLCLFVFLSACGTNSPSGPSSKGPYSNKPVGTGMTPEPGTHGEPLVSPSGHYESMIASDGVDFIGSDNGRVYALGGSDGRVLWQYVTNDPAIVAAVVDGTVYVYADGTSSAVAYALSAGDGRPAWRYNVNDYISQEIVVDGIVYVGTAATADHPHLYALQASSGRLLWRYSTHAVTPGLLSASNGAVYYAAISNVGPGFTEYIAALRATDGHTLWRLRTNSADGFAYAVSAESGGAVFISTNNGAVYAVRVRDGALLWHVARDSIFPGVPSAAVPLVENGIVYVSGETNTGNPQVLYALRASDGKSLWNATDGNGDGPLLDQPQLVDGVFYVSSFTGVFALRASDGSILWRHTADNPAGPFYVSAGRVYVNSGEGLFVLRTSDGTLLWKQAIPGHSSLSGDSTPLAVAGSIVYTSSDEGFVQAFDGVDGHQLWRYAIQERGVPTPPVYSARVTFTSSTTLQQAIKTITDLGLQTSAVCAFSWQTQTSAASFEDSRNLHVVATVASAPLWLYRLQANPSVQSIDTNDVISCPNDWGVHNPAYIPSSQVGTYVRVTFTGPGYDAALFAVDGLGFRLANPCYEQARARGDKPTWNTIGQESSYAQTHALILATTEFNAGMWQNQLHSLAGVARVETPYQYAC